jgi:hypothetical protein
MSFTPRDTEPAEQPATGADETPQAPGANMLPERQGRRFVVERVLIRLVATGGIVGIGVLLGAVLSSSNVQGWVMGLVIALVTVVLSALLWSSRQL